MRRVLFMDDREIKGLLMQALGDYVASYDAARAKAAITMYTEERYGQEKVMGKCVQRIAYIQKAIQEFHQKVLVRDVLKQCLEDCNAAYEDARVKAEEAFIRDRSYYEKIKGHCVGRRIKIVAALAELT